MSAIDWNLARHLRKTHRYCVQKCKTNKQKKTKTNEYQQFVYGQVKLTAENVHHLTTFYTIILSLYYSQIRSIRGTETKLCSTGCYNKSTPWKETKDYADTIFSSGSKESDTEDNTPQPLSQLPSQLVRPHVWMKTPKSSFPTTKCINVYCKEEKRELKRQVESLKQEIENCKVGT